MEPYGTLPRGGLPSSPTFFLSYTQLSYARQSYASVVLIPIQGPFQQFYNLTVLHSLVLCQATAFFNQSYVPLVLRCSLLNQICPLVLRCSLLNQICPLVLTFTSPTLNEAVVPPNLPTSPKDHQTYAGFFPQKIGLHRFYFLSIFFFAFFL